MLFGTQRASPDAIAGPPGALTMDVRSDDESSGRSAVWPLPFAFSAAPSPPATMRLTCGWPSATSDDEVMHTALNARRQEVPDAAPGPRLHGWLTTWLCWVQPWPMAYARAKPAVAEARGLGQHVKSRKRLAEPWPFLWGW